MGDAGQGLSQGAGLSRLLSDNRREGAVMKVFVAGASGALGKRLVPMLVERGHEVVGMTRSSAKSELLPELGARPVVADALDREAVMRAVIGAAPDVVVHELTSLSGDLDLRHFAR